MPHLVSGRWYLTTHSNFDELMEAMGLTDVMRSRLVPLLTTTGPKGHVSDYVIDLTLNALRRCTYVNDQLVNEIVVRLGDDVPGWFNNKFMTMRLSIDGVTKLVYHETGDSYLLSGVIEARGSTLEVKWSCGHVTCVMTYTKINGDE